MSTKIMAQQQYLSSSAHTAEDDIYGVTPQQTGISQSAGPATRYPAEDERHGQHNYKPSQEDPFADRSHDPFADHRQDPFDDDQDEKSPALPPRRASFTRYDPTPTMYHTQPVTYERTKERVVAYMLPLPAPHGADGQPVPVPPRFMLYLPPSPDRMKPPADADTKERKRDKAVRKWQAEVRKAKTYNGTVVSFSGLYCASVRGAVYCLSLIQRSELTFLSRLPRATLKELAFVHPGSASEGDPGAAAAAAMTDRRRFELVKEEFKRNKFIAKRDFWIGAVLLPFAQGVDFAIPVGGGFTEVTLVWMIITGSAWKTASEMMKRLVYNGDVEMRNLPNTQRRLNGGAGDASGVGAAVARQDTVDSNDDLEKGNTNNNGGGKEKKSWWKKAPKPAVETVFRASDTLAPLSRYLQAACHARNAAAFPDVGAPDTEAGVLTSVGWTPAVREGLSDEDAAADVAWQIRQATEDLRQAVAKAAKTWDKFCGAYVKDPERALREEEREAEKRVKQEEKERVKREKREAKERGGGGR